MDPGAEHVSVTSTDLVRAACDLGFARPEDREAYVSTFMVLLDPDVEVVANGSERNGRAKRGVEEVRELLSRSAADWDALRIEAKEVVEIGDRVLASGRVVARARDHGARVELPFASVWTPRDGKVARIESYGDRAEAAAVCGIEP